MNQYYNVKVELSISQLNKLKSATKSSTDVTLGLSSNMTGSSEINFLHNSLITDWQVLCLCKAFASNSSVNVKLSKTQLLKIIQ